MMFEHKSKKLISKEKFFKRQVKYFFFSILLLISSLAVGVLGYHHIAQLNWLDSLLNASMILTGMGPVNQMSNDAAKLFAAFYAIFSGVAFLTFVGTLFAPLYHRFLHRFHLDIEE